MSGGLLEVAPSKKKKNVGDSIWMDKKDTEEELFVLPLFPNPTMRNNMLSLCMSSIQIVNFLFQCDLYAIGRELRKRKRI